MATPLIFKMGTGEITNPTPGTYYISKTEKDGTFKWNIQIADSEGNLYDILTPDNVKGLEYIDDEGKPLNITAKDFKVLEKQLEELDKNLTDSTDNIKDNYMPLTGGTFIGDVEFGEANDIDNTANVVFNNNVTFNEVPVIIKSIGEGDALEYEVATLIEVESAINASAAEINTNIDNLNKNFADYQTANDNKVNNKINKANDTFTGTTNFGTKNDGITTNFYGVQNFNGTTNFINNVELKGTTQITGTIEIPTPTSDNHAATKHYIDIIDKDLSDNITELTDNKAGRDEVNIFTNSNTFQGGVSFDGSQVGVNSPITLADTINMIQLPLITDEDNYIATSNNQLITKKHVDGIQTSLQKNIKDVSDIAIDAKAKIDAFLLDAEATENAVDTLKEIQHELNQDAEGSMAATMLGEITKLKEGTTPAGKATADANGNNIVDTYETKSDANDAHEAIDARITKFENAIKFQNTNQAVFQQWPLLKNPNNFIAHSDNNSFVIKSYVDSKAETLDEKFGSYLPLTGGTITGNVHLEGAMTQADGFQIQLGAGPVSDMNAATKKYVDDAINTLQTYLAGELSDLL